eukprot:c17224_g1_i3.p1 GENE.c17224_g1_i3~~c17224_g1_i3.p1  ORF type:complete len:655 (+),score=227.39 c17224_g1_i3:29-1966(+)
MYFENRPKTRSRGIRLSIISDESLDVFYTPLADILEAAGLTDSDVEDILQFTRKKLAVSEGLVASKSSFLQVRHASEENEEAVVLPLSEQEASEITQSYPWFSTVNGALDDLMMSEHKYICSIEDILIKKFVKPLEAKYGTPDKSHNPHQKVFVMGKNKNCPTPEEINALFSNIDVILSYNKSFLGKLMEMRRDRGLAESLAQEFILFAPCFQMYSTYISGFGNAVNLLDSLREKYPSFHSLLHEIETQKYSIQGEEMNGDLLLLLSLPLNRIPKYLTILQTVRDCLPPNTLDVTRVEEAMSALEDIQNCAGTRLTNNLDNDKKVFSLVSEIDGYEEYFLPHRRFVYQLRGDWTDSHNELHKQGNLVLFNDLILACISQKRVLGNFGKEFLVKDAISLFCATTKVQDPKHLIITTDAGQSITISFSTERELAVWNSKLLKLIPELGTGTKVFGVPLSVVMARSSETHDVPEFLYRSLEVIKQKYMDEEGIFRKSGGNEEIKSLKQKIDSGETYSLEDADPHSISGLVKLYFRELPVSVFSTIQDQLISTSETMRNDEECSKKFKTLLSENLDSFTIKLLKYLFQFLVELSHHSNNNLMTLSNLALVIGPNLMISAQPLSPMEEALRSTKVNRVVQLMLENLALIF